LKRIFDRKISEKITRGYKPEEVKSLFGDIKEVDSVEYYYFLPDRKFPRESKRLANHPIEEVLSFLDGNFSESPDFFVEIHQKLYKSGKCEIIFRRISIRGEITRLAVVTLRKAL